MFYIPGVVYHDPWWQRWYGYFECAKPYISFALDKPIKEPVPGLQKPNTIASEWKCAWRSSMLQRQPVSLEEAK